MMQHKSKSTQQSEYEERKEKLVRLLEDGIMPYPSKANCTHTIAQIISDFEKYQEEQTPVTLCGRLRSKRLHGNLAFADLEDASGRLQIALNKKELTDSTTYKKFTKLIDVGDFIEISGTLFVTKTGQQTVQVREWRLLTKALRGLPTEHFGLKDEDEQFRKRYIDLLLNDDKRALFARRAKFWYVMRHFLEERGFMHVETPVLEVTTGGAEARPFTTHHNDFDLDVHLRISVGELWQKRLMAAGFEKTFEIGRVFRNEGSSPNHLQEFTNMEFYWAYANFRDGMALTQEMYRYIAQEVYGTTVFSAHDMTFDLAQPWEEIDYVSEVQKQTGLNVLTATKEDMLKKLEELGVHHDGKNKERLIDNLWKYCRTQIAGPAFLIGHPTIIAPLAKRREDNPDITEKFQILLAGAEVGTGYSELNDPLDQRKRFETQQKILEAGDDEAMMPDWDFVEMLEYGMPPTCGFGAGERLFAFLEGKTLREATLFPLMKPKK